MSAPDSAEKMTTQGSAEPTDGAAARRQVVRVQTGVRLEKRMVKVLKALAEYHDISLGDLIEGIVLHSFDGRCAFGERSLGAIREFKKLYGLDLGAGDSHLLTEGSEGRGTPRR
ncbi:MAG: hypothetical protein AAF725_16035 [Acidobacteriota bacterium]